MTRSTAIDRIMTATNAEDVIIATTGLISREIYERFDSARVLYVPGSMGLASSIGLGITLKSTRRICIVDGDASLLMNLGSMVTIGHTQPTGLLHIVLNNRAYGSCNEEPSMSDDAHLDRVATDVGYRYVKVVSEPPELERAICDFTLGPGFILAQIDLGGRRDFKRPLDLAGIKARFMRFLAGQPS